jgi:hypothetical protein
MPDILKSFKVLCKIDKNDGNGIKDDYPVFTKANDDVDAEKNVKYYWVMEKPEVSYYGVTKIIEM